MRSKRAEDGCKNASHCSSPGRRGSAATETKSHGASQQHTRGEKDSACGRNRSYSKPRYPKGHPRVATAPLA